MSCPSCGHSEYYFGLTGHNCPNPDCCHYQNGTINEQANQPQTVEKVVVDFSDCKASARLARQARIKEDTKTSESKE